MIHPDPDVADASAWFRERGWEVVLRDRTADDVGGRHQPEIERGFVWWCDLVSIDHPEIVLDGFGIARSAADATVGARDRWGREGFRPDEPEGDPDVNDDMVSAAIQEFWAVANTVDDDPASSAWDVITDAHLQFLFEGPFLRPPTTAQRDALVTAANRMYDTDQITSDQIDRWIDEVRWRWPTTMTVLWYTDDGWSDHEPG